MDCRAVLFAGKVCNYSYAFVSSKNVFLAYPQVDVFVFLECLMNWSTVIVTEDHYS